MSEAPPQKSHAGRWITVIVLALVLYVVSAAPVVIMLIKNSFFDLPPFVHKTVASFYWPAFWLQNTPPLRPYYRDWCRFWSKFIGAHMKDGHPESIIFIG